MSINKTLFMTGLLQIKTLLITEMILIIHSVRIRNTLSFLTDHTGHFFLNIDWKNSKPHKKGHVINSLRIESACYVIDTICM